MKEKKSFFLWLFLFIFLTTYSVDLSKKNENSFFSIEKIDIYGFNNSNQNNIEEALNQFKGENIIFINIRHLEETIKDFPFVKGLKLKKVYPDKIKVTIYEFTPIGLFIDNNKEFVLTDEGKMFESKKDKKFEILPLVQGKDAEKNFYTFYSSLESTEFQTELIKQFNFFDIKRWDIILKDDKIIKLPVEDYKNSLKRFLSIYEKESFKNFKVFDFRMKGQLVLE